MSDSTNDYLLDDDDEQSLLLTIEGCLIGALLIAAAVVYLAIEGIRRLQRS